MTPTRTPRVVDALAGALQGSERAANGALVDIGAGLGYFSLAAAARGHQVYAFELAPSSLELLRHSIDANGFQGLIQVNEVSLGDAEDTICVAREGVSEAIQVWMRLLPVLASLLSPWSRKYDQGCAQEHQQDLQMCRSGLAVVIMVVCVW